MFQLIDLSNIYINKYGRKKLMDLFKNIIFTKVIFKYSKKITIRFINIT